MWDSDYTALMFCLDFYQSKTYGNLKGYGDGVFAGVSVSICAFINGSFK